VNHITAAETLIRIAATAAHGSDEDDGVVVSDADFFEITAVAKWLMAGAIERRQEPTATRWPAVPLAVIERLAIEARIRECGNFTAAAKSLKIDPATIYRLRQRWQNEDSKRFVVV